MIGGVAIVGENPELRERLRFLQNAVGGDQRAVRQLFGPARPEDAGRADGAALRQRR